MALPAAFLSEDQFTCSICLEVFNDPVTTPCGHSFCQACLSSYWDGQRGGRGGNMFYQCPLCKESFRKRPELHVNRTLKEITEQFKQMADTRIPVDGTAGGVENANSHPHHHHHPALSLPQRPGEMPESVFAEMMTRFQQLHSGAGMPYTTLPNPNDPHPQSPSPVNTHLPFQAQNNEHHDLPPHCLPPRRYQTMLLRL